MSTAKNATVSATVSVRVKSAGEPARTFTAAFSGSELRALLAAVHGATSAAYPSGRARLKLEGLFAQVDITTGRTPL